MSSHPRGVFPRLVVLTAVLLAAAPPPGQLDEQMAALLEQERFFELRTLLEAQTANTPAILYYRGLVANAFNQPAASVDFLTSFLQGAGNEVPETLLRDVLSVLDDDYVMMFQYAKSAEVRDQELPLVKRGMTRSEAEGFQSITELWRTLAAAPPQTVEIPGDTALTLSDAGEAPAVINGVEIPLLPDTGSALSMIASSDAERLGLDILDVAVAIGTATGRVIKAKACLVPELRLGGIRVRNAVFLVVPEERLYFSEIRRQLHGLLGFPILAGLGELTFTRGKKLLVNSPPDLQGPPNLFLGRTNPIVEAQFEGKRLLFFLDTGSFQTELFPRFFKAFTPEVLRSGIYMPATIEGVGSHSRTPVYLMSGLTFRVAGQDVRFNSTVPVLTQDTSEPSGSLDGVFGLDILASLQELTLNYGAMRLSLR